MSVNDELLKRAAATPLKARAIEELARHIGKERDTEALLKAAVNSEWPAAFSRIFLGLADKDERYSKDVLRHFYHLLPSLASVALLAEKTVDDGRVVLKEALEAGGGSDSLKRAIKELLADEEHPSWISARQGSSAVIAEFEEMESYRQVKKPLRKSGATGRNAPCPCGSGKKYKKCCMNNEEEEVELLVLKALEVEDLSKMGPFELATLDYARLPSPLIPIYHNVLIKIGDAASVERFWKHYGLSEELRNYFEDSRSFLAEKGYGDRLKALEKLADKIVDGEGFAAAILRRELCPGEFAVRR